MSTKKHLIKSTTIISLSTILSRIFGFIRDMIIAKFLGTGLVADAFLASFSIPNMLRHLMGEGVLSAGLVPVFTESIEKKGKQDTNALMNSVFWMILLVSIFITLAVVFFTPFLVKLVVPGFISSPEKLNLTIKTTRFLMPYLIFIGLSSWIIGILHSYKHFFIPAISSAVFNFGIIISSLFLGIFFHRPLEGIVAGVVLGGIMQVLVQWPLLFRSGFEIQFIFWHPSIKRIIKMVGPAVFALAVTEINIAVTRIFASSASLAGEGAISILYYASRLIQLPMGIFTAAISTAILPTLSSQFIEGDIEKVKLTVFYAFRFALFIVIPAATGLIVLRVPIIRLLFERGAFGPAATQQTASALLFYSAGILGYAGVKIITPVFYSLGDTFTPAKIALTMLGTSVLLDFILVRMMKFPGLALSVSISNFIQLALLIIFLKKKIGAMGFKNILLPLSKVIIISSIMGISCFWLFNFIEKFIVLDLASQIFEVGICISSGAIIFLFLSYIFKLKEMEILKEIIGKRG
ncbi:MAG: murein biosynthesis integral membrane protein MurJ [bacterium]